MSTGPTGLLISRGLTLSGEGNYYRADALVLNSAKIKLRGCWLCRYDSNKGVLIMPFNYEGPTLTTSDTIFFDILRTDSNIDATHTSNHSNLPIPAIDENSFSLLNGSEFNSGGVSVSIFKLSSSTFTELCPAVQVTSSSATLSLSETMSSDDSYFLCVDIGLGDGTFTFSDNLDNPWKNSDIKIYRKEDIPSSESLSSVVDEDFLNEIFETTCTIGDTISGAPVADYNNQASIRYVSGGVSESVCFMLSLDTNVTKLDDDLKITSAASSGLTTVVINHNVTVFGTKRLAVYTSSGQYKGKVAISGSPTNVTTTTMITGQAYIAALMASDPTTDPLFSQQGILFTYEFTA